MYSRALYLTRAVRVTEHHHELFFIERRSQFIPPLVRVHHGPAGVHRRCLRPDELDRHRDHRRRDPTVLGPGASSPNPSHLSRRFRFVRRLRLYFGRNLATDFTRGSAQSHLG